MLDFKKIVCCSLVLTVGNLHGYFFNIQKWSNGQQTLYLFSDVHQDVCDFGQRIDLINAAKSMGAFVIVEDKLEFNGAVQLMGKLGKLEGDEGVAKARAYLSMVPLMMALYDDCYVKTPTGKLNVNPAYDPNHDYSNLLPANALQIIRTNIPPLLGLTQFCRQQGICAKNVEFRFLILIADVIEIYDIVTKELKLYNDSALLNIYYEKILKNSYANKLIQKLKPIAQANPFMTFDEFCSDQSLYKQVFDSLYKEYESEYTYFNFQKGKEEDYRQHRVIACHSKIIEAKILHEIYSNSQYPIIFVCAGGCHIENISVVLSQMGYKLIRNTGKTLKEHVNSNKCAIVRINKYFELYPE